jgi:hypothetical protein
MTQMPSTAIDRVTTLPSWRRRLPRPSEHCGVVIRQTFSAPC